MGAACESSNSAHALGIFGVNVSKLYKKKTGMDVMSNLCVMGKLKWEVEKAKCTLSSQVSTKLKIENFKGGNDFLETLMWAKVPQHVCM